MKRIISFASVLLVAVVMAPGEHRRVPPADWIPARWHSHDPSTLSLLAKSPINALLLERGDWDSAFVRAATKQGVASIGVIRAGDDAQKAAREAVSRKLAGVVFEGDFDPSVQDSVRSVMKRAHRVYIELPTRARIKIAGKDPILGTCQGLWPGLEIEHGGKTLAGPTSAPWINTNGGFLRFLVAQGSDAVWIAADPPPQTIFPVERYLQAIGDAALPGARWVLSLDQDFEHRLQINEPNSLKDWARIAGQLTFFEQWRKADRFGKFGVIIDRNTGGLLSGFLLDLLAAQRTSVIVIPPGQVSPIKLKNITALLNLSPGPLTPDERSAIHNFEARGGAVLSPPANLRFPEPSTGLIVPSRRDLDRLQGMWELVYNATLRKNFGVRTFNTAGMMTGVVTMNQGRSVVVHLLNFTDFEGDAITVHALGDWKQAHLFQPGAPRRELMPYPVKDGTAVDIDRFATSVAIQFE